ncbi:glutaredoxin family protein [Naasia lichenicola]|uniref:Glutaredoxin family protein n=1 Tax=Naasia lichenicola TaxID=2565933 RepID=A0A4S4FKU1_9MICO|nr:glutaredoxin family protein [Naasia lichenicola]
MPKRLTLIGKPGCHLCDEARTVVDRVVTTLPTGSVVVEERDILQDAELFDRYVEEIPVVLIDGEEHGHWRFDDERLKAALS